MRFFLPLLVVIAIIISCILSLQNVADAQEQFRYKVCTADELRKSVEQVCMRLSKREEFAGLSMGPYGSMSHVQSHSLVSSENLRTTPLTDAELKALLNASSPYVRGNRKRSQIHQHNRELRTRRNAPLSDTELCDYLDTCCNRSCVIDAMDLATFCITAK